MPYVSVLGQAEELDRWLMKRKKAEESEHKS